MTRVFVAMENELLVVRNEDGGWKLDVTLRGSSPQCVAGDPLKSDLVYYGTFGEGLRRSNDSGRTWKVIGRGVVSPQVTCLAVSLVERNAGLGAVYVGTEPSALFRSEDGEESWKHLDGLNSLPSATTWSFPPRPETHHVRWIELDPVIARRIFLCIEAGALVRSKDSGESWQDRVVGGPYDTHTLATHKRASGRLYSSAGDGYFGSYDDGDTWERLDIPWSTSLRS